MRERVSIDPLSSSPSKPTLSGTASLDTGEALRVAVNGTSFSPGDGHLRFDPVEAVWQLQLPATSRLGVYRVRALIYKGGQIVSRGEALLCLKGGLPFGSNIFPDTLFANGDGLADPFVFAMVDTVPATQAMPNRVELAVTAVA